LVEAKLVKLSTGTRAMHKFGKFGYWYTQEVIYFAIPVPDPIIRAVVNRAVTLQSTRQSLNP